MLDSIKPLPAGPNGEERFRANLCFKIAIFSVRFHFAVNVRRESNRLLELSYHAGKVRDLLIRLQLQSEQAESTILQCRVRFDIYSLGWLVNLFVKHHPEIEWGIHPGSALSIAQAVRRLAES